MIPSFLMMILITYGIKEQNPWLQYGSILLLFAGTILYQGIQAARSRDEIDANHDEARKVMRQKGILEVKRDEVTSAKRSGKSIGGLSPTTSLVFILPLIIFMATGYLLSQLVQDIEPWQSYLVGFLITMPVSTILSIKTGLGSMTPTISPNVYYVSDKGIVFEQMNQHYILHYPIVTMELKEESNCVEVQGQPTKSPLIPNRIRLFNKDAKKLQRLLTRFTG
jgi:uncharacterized membrane protein